MGLREDLEEKSNEELMRLYKEGPARAEDKDKVVRTAGEILSERGVPLPKKRATAKSQASDRESRLTIWEAQDEHDIMTRSHPNKAKSDRSTSYSSDRFNNSYFGFERLIATKVIKFLYGLGFLAISVGGIIAISQGEELTGQELLIPGILALTVGNVVWRLFCESMIVVFDIHDRITDLHSALQDILHAIEGIQNLRNPNTNADEKTGND